MDELEKEKILNKMDLEEEQARLKANNAVSRAVKKADRNAQKRDFQNKNQEPPVDMATVKEQEEKANRKGHTIVKLRDKSRAGFTQLVNDNFYYLIQHGYLTNAEKAFILDIMAFVELNSNALVMYRETDEGLAKVPGAFPKVLELARILKRTSRNTRQLLSQLLEKGILYEIVDTQTIKQYGRPIEERPLFCNPEVIIAADKNHINLTLCRIHWQNDRLEKKKIKLPWKIWYAPGMKHGKLYRRKTWLQKNK